jgi:hypothetical protein
MLSAGSIRGARLDTPPGESAAFLDGTQRSRVWLSGCSEWEPRYLERCNWRNVGCTAPEASALVRFFGLPPTLLQPAPGGAPVTARSTAAIRSRSSSGNGRSRSFSSVMPHDTTDASTDPQPTLADYCLWWPVGEPEPCYDEAAFVLLRSSGEWLAFRPRGSEGTIWCSTGRSGRRRARATVA